MLEFGFNAIEYGKVVLAACFITDLGTVLALGLIFAPFTYKTLVFAAVGIAAFVVLPWVTPRFFKAYAGRPSELESKRIMKVRRSVCAARPQKSRRPSARRTDPGVGGCPGSRVTHAGRHAA